MGVLTQAKINELLLEISDYPSLEYLCLTEIGFRPEAAASYVIDGFKLASYYCRSNIVVVFGSGEMPRVRMLICLVSAVNWILKYVL